MPAIPSTWLEEFTVNLTTADSQARPHVTHLANGNILVAWDSTNNTGVGAATGVDVIGQLFSPLGERIGVEFRVNDSFFADDERNADVAALDSGGFVAVYEDFDVVNNTRAIRLTERDADGLSPATVTIIADASNNADPAFFNPVVASSSNTSTLVVYQEEEVGGDSRIAGVIYDSVANTAGAVISLINFAGNNTDPEVAVLTNGNYAIVASTVEAGDQTIGLRIINAAGGSVLPATQIASTVGDTENDREASVAALTGGGFVVSWTNTDGNDTDILAQRFDAAGVAQGSVINVGDGGATDNNNESAVVALLDGGFIVFYDNDIAGELRGSRYNSAGGLVAGSFTIASGGGGIDEIDAELLLDGRVAVTFERANGEIGMEIIDVRDQPNDPGVYTPDQFQIGTIGDDVFTADGNSEFVFGHDGNDTITESGQIRSYFGGNGNDTLNVVSPINDDVHDGGAGNDTIDWSASFVSGGAFNLLTGLATDGGQDEIMVGFENIIGTSNADQIVGDNFVNTLSGGLGNDAINGRGGDDILLGGGGNDTLIGSIGRDALNGGADTDTASYAGAAAGVRAFLANAPQNNGEAAGDTYVSIENLTGTGFDDTLVGNAVANTIRGGAGVDRMNGLEGADILFGEGGNDIFLFSSVAHTLPGAGNRDTVRDFEDAGDNDTIDLSGFAGVLTFVGAGAFTAAQQVRAFQSGTDVLIQINTAGNFNPESEILLFNTAIAQVNAADFVL